MKKILLILLSVCIIGACSSSKNVASNDSKKKQKDTVKRWTHNRLLKTDNYDIKYTKAKEYYQKKKYLKAIDLLEQLVPHDKGLTRGEEVTYMYCVSNMEIGDYLYAAHHFKKFYSLYPSSKYAEKALFTGAYCYYLESPRWSLDQEPTQEAITHFQLFLSKFPNSKYVDSCNTLIDILRYTIEKKTYMAAKLYYDLEYYKAATVALSNAIIKYPDSQFNEDALFYSIKAHYKYASGSIKKKQLQRYKKTLLVCSKYEELYPNGKHIDEVKKISTNTNKKIT